jgi:valyl-tRNA synthetase
LYSFFWGDYCDWYLEVSKIRQTDPAVKSHVLAIQDLCLREFLLMLHPFMPFISEELWHALGYGNVSEFVQNAKLDINELHFLLTDNGPFASTIADVDPVRASFPYDENAAEDLRLFVSVARALKARNNLAARRDVKFALTETPRAKKHLAAQKVKLLSLCGASEITLVPTDWVASPSSAAAPTLLGTLYLDLAGTIDKVAEGTRLTKELEKLTQHIASQEAKLANEAFVAKAPAKVIEGARAQLAENVAKREELKRLLAALG